MSDPDALPFCDLRTQYAALREAIAARMQRVLDHGQYILGPEVAELEQALCAFSGALAARALMPSLIAVVPWLVTYFWPLRGGAVTTGMSFKRVMRAF